MTINLQGTPERHRRGYRDGHTLTLSIQRQYLGLQWVCPHQGQTFTTVESAPLCRIGIDEAGIESLSPACVPGEHFGWLGAEAFAAPGDVDFDLPVLAVPIHVEWWFESAEEFCALPYQPDPAQAVKLSGTQQVTMTSESGMAVSLPGSGSASSSSPAPATALAEFLQPVYDLDDVVPASGLSSVGRRAGG
jgi:hypothetical protein